MLDTPMIALHQAKRCCFEKDTLEHRHIPPRQMTTADKKIAVSFYTDFV